jgi:hypothetical protein
MSQRETFYAHLKNIASGYTQSVAIKKIMQLQKIKASKKHIKAGTHKRQVAELARLTAWRIFFLSERGRPQTYAIWFSSSTGRSSYS